MTVREFAKRHVYKILFAEVLLLVIAIVLVAGLLSIYRDNLVPEKDLPGLRNEISDRTKEELNALVKRNPHILGGWIFVRNYDAHTYPILHYTANHPIAEQFIADFKRKQTSPNEGMPSSVSTLNPSSVSANTAEATVGTIRCVEITKSLIIYFTPSISTVAKTICSATLPPFEVADKVNLQIVAISGLPLDSPQLREVHRTLLQLQIDIYNRDYNGQETWIDSDLNR